MSIGLYLEDLQLGQVYLSGTYEVSAEEIKEFAAKYDPQPFHLDEAAAVGTFFDGLAASGWLTASITMRLLVESLPIANGLVGAGADITWTRPTRAGDILQVETEIIDMAAMPTRPNSGLVTVRSRVRNQDRKVAQVMTAKLLVPRKSGETISTGII